MGKQLEVSEVGMKFKFNNKLEECGDLKIVQWNEWLFVCRKDHSEISRDFYYRVQHGVSSKKNAHLRKFGESFEGVFHLDEMESAIEYLHLAAENA